MSDPMSIVRSVTVRQLIPEGLAQMALGPELAVLPGGLNIFVVTGTDLVEVLCARAWQLSHEPAQLLATMGEVGLCDPHSGTDEVARLEQAAHYAADEIRDSVGLDPQCRLPRVPLRSVPAGAAARSLHRPQHRGDLPRQYDPPLKTHLSGDVFRWGRSSYSLSVCRSWWGAR